jgi:hypothetical protein
VILELLDKYSDLTVADSFFSSESRLHHKSLHDESGSTLLVAHVVTLIAITATAFLL